MTTNLPDSPPFSRARPAAAVNASVRTLVALAAAAIAGGASVVVARTTAFSIDRIDTESAWTWSQPEAPREASATAAAVLADATATPAAKADAAQAIVTRALSQPEAREQLERLLAGPAAESSPAWFVLGAMAKESTLPDWLFPPVSAVIDRADERTAARAVSVLGEIRTRESVRQILGVCNTTGSALVKRSGWAALARLSGRMDLGESARAWGNWLNESEMLSNQEWAERLAQGLARRADAAEADRQAALVRLVDSYRRLHVELSVDQRSAFLAGLLADDIDEIRSLGFELASRELSENAKLGPEVAGAATGLLGSPIAGVRERAALLVSQISPAGAQSAVIATLLREREPGAASALLRAAARWPDPALLDTALSWVSPGGAATSSAVDYLRTLHRAGFIQAAEERQRVLSAVRALLPDGVPSGACDLLVGLGTEDDVRSVAILLSSNNASLRLAAAQALLIVPDHVDDILLAAARDPELFDVAVRAVSMYWPTADGFNSIAALKAPSPDAWRRGLLRLAELMPAPDLVRVATTAEPQLREPLLANLTSLNRILSERYSTATFEALGRGLMMLAKIRLDLNKPDSALAALDAMEELPVLQGEQAVNSIRVESLLRLGRVSEAAEIPCQPRPWLDALASSLDKPFGRVIADGIASKFAGTLTPEEKERLAALVQRIAPATAQVPLPDGR